MPKSFLSKFKKFISHHKRKTRGGKKHKHSKIKKRHRQKNSKTRKRSKLRRIRPAK